MEKSDKPKLSTSDLAAFYFLYIFGTMVLAFGLMVLGIQLFPEFFIGVVLLFLGGLAFGFIFGFYAGKKLGIKWDTTFYMPR